MANLKCVIVGDATVGKTCVLISYIKNEFPNDYVPITFDNYSVDVSVDGQEMKLGLWDTAGQEDYDRLRPLVYLGTGILILCFSVVDPASFENIRKKWIQEVKSCAPGVPFIIIGTKTDLRGDSTTLRELESRNQEVVTRAQGEALCGELKGHKYLECSALTQSGLQEIFDECIRCFIQGQNEARNPKQRCNMM